MSHNYTARITWTGNTGQGTSSYRGFSRDHDIIVTGRPVLKGSSDPAFRGDPARHNPEDLLLASISACHMLWYLHLAVGAGIIVTAYVDDATAEMAMNPDGSGQFTMATLNPSVTIASGDEAVAMALHHDAHEKCFIARSMNFPIHHRPTIIRA